MLRRFLTENARAARALLAMSGVLALGLTFAVMVLRHGEEDAEVIRKVNKMLWSVSELNYSSQLFATSLFKLSGDPALLDDTRVAFDVMWSRFDGVRREDLLRMDGFEQVFLNYEQFLTETDAILFSETEIPPEMLVALASKITEIARSARQTWLDNFSVRRSSWQIADSISRNKNDYRLMEALVAFLVLCLLAYVFAEIWFAGRASQKEAALRQAASRASEAKSRFIATVSHEVRTPLNGILGSADLLADTHLSAEQERYVHVLRQSGGVLLDMINDVLDFSKLEAQQFSIISVDFNLDDVLQTAQGLYAPLARQKGIGLSARQAEMHAPHLHGDGRRLQQVLNNLISNAIKFTDRGTVDISVNYSATPVGDAPAGLFLWVSDTGCGIAADEVPHVFQPFGQSSSGLDRAHAGTGLGLTISRDLCEAMGGHLRVTSALGVGSTFEVFVPFPRAIDDVEQQAKVALPTHMPDLSAQDVLVVDDNQTNRFIMRKLLAKLECIPREAESGEVALSQAAERMPSLVFMDIQMPGMDGVTATREMLAQARAGSNGRVPTVIGVTANTQPDQIATYLEVGMQDVVAKPIRAVDLHAALRFVFAKEHESETPGWDCPNCGDRGAAGHISGHVRCSCAK